jgi:hypothetical protein
MNNYGNRGSYNNGRGNYNGNRNGYQNSRANYSGGNDNQEKQNDKKFGAKFKVRGIVCTDKQTGEGFSRINTRNGSAMCSVNIMIAKYQNTGDRDRDGNTVWKENAEFFRLVAFGPVAETVMSMVKAKSIMEFTGDIRMQKAENGFSSPSFVIEKVDMVKEYSGSNSGVQNSGYQRNDNQRNGYQNNGYQRTNGNSGGYNYDDRPNNYSQRGSSARPSNPQPPVEPENDYAPGDDGNDIPF